MRLNLPVSQREHPFPTGQTLVSTPDLKGRILHCNPAFLEVSGYAQEELLGQAHNLIRHLDMPAEAFRDMWDSISAGHRWSGVVKNRRKNGDHSWVHAHVTPLTDEGRPIAYLSMRSSTDTAHQASSVAHELGSVSSRSAEVVHHVTDTMAQISSASHRIGEIIQVIEGIAFQTNILALNAAVESARAGERQTRKAQDSIDETLSSVQDFARLINTIHHGADEQLNGISQVNQAINQMETIPQQNAGMVEALAKSAADMLRQVDEVQASVRIFRLDRQERMERLPNAPLLRKLAKARNAEPRTR